MSTQTIKLKKFQAQALHTLSKNKTIFLAVQAPTGSGKSLIFQSYLQKNKKERALMITPLVALARQQVERFKAFSITSSFYTENKNDDQSQVVIISPESIEFLSRKKQWVTWCQKNQFSFCILDEVHCATEWGEEFRPAYGLLWEALKEVSWKKMLCLSATYSPEIKKKLFLFQSSFVFQGEFQFPKNLKITLKKAYSEEKIRILEALLEYKKDTKFLCFISSRNWCEKLSAYFLWKGYSVDFFHSERSHEEKEFVIRRLESEKLQGVFCTSAFGMGVDFKGLQNVFIWEARGSWTELVQSMGRVGRSEEAGNAIVFWTPEDSLVQKVGLSVFQKESNFVRLISSYFNNVNFLS